MPDDEDRNDERTFTAAEVEAAIAAARADEQRSPEQRELQTMIDGAVDRALSEDRIEGVVSRFLDRVAGDDDDDPDRDNAPGGTEETGFDKLTKLVREGLGLGS